MFLRAFEKVLKIFSSHNRKLLATGSKFPAFPEENKKNEEEVEEKKDDVNECQSRTDLDKITHTGQVFDKNDYRNVRFLNAKRYVNDNWGITYTLSAKPLEVTDRIVSCDGGGSMGHPKFYINLDKPGKHFCYYCGKSFIRKITEFEICSNTTPSETNTTTTATNSTSNETNTTITEGDNTNTETNSTITETPCDSAKPENPL